MKNMVLVNCPIPPVTIPAVFPKGFKGSMPVNTIPPLSPPAPNRFVPTIFESPPMESVGFVTVPLETFVVTPIFMKSIANTKKLLYIG